MTELDPHLVSLIAPTSIEAEQYRKLRNAMEHVAKDGETCVIAVSSPGDGEGKTLTAINLAGALAQSEKKKVLLLDADLRTSPMAQSLGLPRQRGLSEAIASGDSLESIVVRSLPFNLAVVPAGTTQAAPYEMLSSAHFRQLLVQARRDYDFIVVDTPPLLPVSDCRLIVDLVDGFVLVVAAHRTPRKSIEEALRMIGQDKIFSLVLNAADRPLFGYW